MQHRDRKYSEGWLRGEVVECERVRRMLGPPILAMDSVDWGLSAGTACRILRVPGDGLIAATHKAEAAHDSGRVCLGQGTATGRMGVGTII